jgi:hypothetical protein
MYVSASLHCHAYHTSLVAAVHIRIHRQDLANYNTSMIIIIVLQDKRGNTVDCPHIPS